MQSRKIKLLSKVRRNSDQIMFLLSISLIMHASAQNNALYNPEQIHISFGLNYDDMFISWASTGTNEYPSQSPYVAYGVEPGKYSTRVPSTVYTYTDGNWTGLLYWSHVQSLTQNTKYYYKIISQSYNSSEYSFTFNHPSSLPSKPFEFLLIGDMGAAMDSNECVKSGGCSNDTITALQDDILNHEYAFMIHVGDIAYTSGHSMIWDLYLNQMQNITASMPYMVCPGNHEHYYNFSGYKSRFNMPGAAMNKGESNLYYSWIYGGVYFLAYSTEHNFSIGSAQYEFMANDLKSHANNKDIKWRILYGHKPIYCSTNDYYDCAQNGPRYIEPVIEPLLKEYQFDLYFAGHLHNYERTYSVYNFTNIENKLNNDAAGVYVNPKYTVHVVIGMSGDNEGLTNSWYNPQPEWSAYRVTKLGYTKLKIYNQTRLEFKFIDSVSMETVDQLVIQK
eukprot:62410_1